MPAQLTRVTEVQESALGCAAGSKQQGSLTLTAPELGRQSS